MDILKLGGVFHHPDPKRRRTVLAAGAAGLLTAMAWLTLAVWGRPAYLKHPRSVADYHLLAKYYNGRQETEKAMAAARQALALDPRSAKAFMDLGNAFVAKAFYLTAIERFREALALIGPDEVNRQIILRNLGEISLREGRGEDAWESFSSAHAINDRMIKALPWTNDPDRPEYYVPLRKKEEFLACAKSRVDLDDTVLKAAARLISRLRWGAAKEVLRDIDDYQRHNADSLYAGIFSALGAEAVARREGRDGPLFDAEDWERDVLNPQVPLPVRLTYVHFLMKIGQDDLAMTFFETLLSPAPDSRSRRQLLEEGTRLAEMAGDTVRQEMFWEALLPLSRSPQETKRIHFELAGLALLRGDDTLAFEKFLDADYFLWILPIEILFAVALAAVAAGILVVLARTFFRKKEEARPAGLYQTRHLFGLLLLFFMLPVLLLPAILGLNYLFPEAFAALPVDLLVLSFLAGEILIVSYCLWVLRERYRLSWETLGFASRGLKVTARWALGGAAVCVAFSLVYLFVFYASGAQEPPSYVSQVVENVLGRNIPGSGSVHAQQLLPIYLLMFLLSVVVPLSEEMAFRVFLLKFFLARTNIWWGILGSSLLFALFHQSAAFFPFFFFIGALLAFVYVKSGSVVPCLVIHGLNNFLCLLATIHLYFQGG